MGALSCKTLWRQYPGRKILFFFLLQSWYRRVSYTTARQQQYCCLGYHLFSRMPSLRTDVPPPSGKIPTFPEGGGTSVHRLSHALFTSRLTIQTFVKLFWLKFMDRLWRVCDNNITPFSCGFRCISLLLLTLLQCIQSKLLAPLQGWHFQFLVSFQEWLAQPWPCESDRTN